MSEKDQLIAMLLRSKIGFFLDRQGDVVVEDLSSGNMTTWCFENGKLVLVMNRNFE